MAIITPSSLISEIRGSVGDVTYSKNRSGPIVKGKLIQPPSNTAPQAAVRADLAAAILAWQAMSQADQNKWMNFTATQKVIKSLGRRMHRTGYNEFISRWQNRIAIGGVSTTFNPLPLVRINPIITAINQGATSITIDYNTLRSVGNCKIGVYATPPISAGINEINPSFYRIIGNFEPTQQVDTQELYTMYTAKFPLGAPDIGKKIGFAIRAINTDNFASGGFFFVQINILGGLVPNVIPSLVQLKRAIATNVGGNITLTLDNPPEIGSVIIMAISSSQIRVFTPPPGVTFIIQAGHKLSFQRTYKFVSVTGTEQSFTFGNASSINWAYTIFEIKDANPTDTFEFIRAIGSTSQVSGLSPFPTPVDFTKNKFALVTAHMNPGRSGPWVSPNGYTRIVSFNSTWNAAYKQIVTDQIGFNPYCASGGGTNQCYTFLIIKPTT